MASERRDGGGRAAGCRPPRRAGFCGPILPERAVHWRRIWGPEAILDRIGQGGQRLGEKTPLECIYFDYKFTENYTIGKSKAVGMYRFCFFLFHFPENRLLGGIE